MAEHKMEIVVAGAGYAGLLATLRLAGRLRTQPVNLTLVNAADVLVERVRLHEFAANQPIKRRPLAGFLAGTGVNFVLGTIVSLDTARRSLAVQTAAGARQLPYDQLLLALGSTIDRDSVPGVRDYAYTLTPSGPLSAAALRERLPALHRAGGHLVVCGAGITGIEAAAEFASSYPGLQVTLLTRGAFAPGLVPGVAAYARQSLQRQGVTIQEHTLVAAVGADTITTSAGPLAYDLCLWAGGFIAPPLARAAGLAVNARGQILIDPFMRALAHPEIFAVGDAAHPREEPGVHVRMSAATATIMGAHGADCLSAIVRGQTPRPLSFAYQGQCIALGRHDAIGFNNYPADIARRPYFTGRLGYAVRELVVRYLAATFSIERRRPGTFFWVGKGRYAAAQRRDPQRECADAAR
ncbi:MAG TPA: FAD-dependent oxidoreductase [Chloroflexia bacterium]|nr:FAD-dependent oxidoreductase [Chloroflexia bacterium]